MDRFDQGRLSGTVYRDANQNGIQDSGESGINRAPVTLTGTNVAGNKFDTTIFTNANGGYQFTGLLLGEYNISVANMPGLVNGTHAAGLAGGTVGATGVSNIRLGRNQDGPGYLLAKISTSTTPHADLEPLATSLTPSISVGATTEVTIVARNNGPDGGGGAIVLNAPAGLVVESATPLTGSFDSATRRWTFPALSAGAESNLQLVVRLNQAGTRTLRATMQPALADPVVVNNEVLLNLSAGGRYRRSNLCQRLGEPSIPRAWFERSAQARWFRAGNR